MYEENWQTSNNRISALLCSSVDENRNSSVDYGKCIKILIDESVSHWTHLTSYP